MQRIIEWHKTADTKPPYASVVLFLKKNMRIIEQGFVFHDHVYTASVTDTSNFDVPFADIEWWTPLSEAEPQEPESSPEAIKAYLLAHEYKLVSENEDAVTFLRDVPWEPVKIFVALYPPNDRNGMWSGEIDELSRAYEPVLVEKRRNVWMGPLSDLEITDLGLTARQPVLRY